MMFRKSFLGSLAAMSAVVLAGWGGGSKAAEPRGFAPAPAPFGGGRYVGSARRGIQSVYFLALDPNFASLICSKLNAAPAGRTIEIEFSAAHDGGRGWANAQNAINSIQSHPLNLVVDFGHLKIAPDHSPADWGRMLFAGLFKANYNKVSFGVEVANEDGGYSPAEWQSYMSQILGGLRAAWMEDRATKNIAFPYSQVVVRRCSSALPPAFKINPGDPAGFATESEFHFPMGSNDDWRSSASVISNDGQIAYRPKIDPNPWAYNGNTPLRQVALQDFENVYSSRSLLLWHPALHLWSFSGNAYHENPKANASPANQQAFLSLLGDFLAN